MLLRTRIALGAVVMAVVITAVMFLSGRQMYRQAENRFEGLMLHSAQMVWEKILDSELEAMGAGMSSITRDREVRNALAKGDAAVLREAVTPAYRRLSTMKVLDRLQVADTRGRILYVAPEGRGGETHKPLVREALAQGKVRRGIERDDDGRLYLDLVFPLYKRGRAVGVAVYQRDLEAALEDYRHSAGADLFVLSPDGRMEAGTAPRLLSALKAALPPAGERSFAIRESGGRHFAVSVNPLQGAGGVPLGHLMSVSDYSDSFDLQRREVWIGMLFSAIVIGLAVAGFFWYVKRAFRPLQQSVAILEKVAEGDLTQEIPKPGRDEIGALLKAIRQTVEGLRAMVQEVKETSAQLEGATQRMQEIAEETGCTVTRQTEETAQVATAIHEMTTTVQQVARNAEGAAGAAQTASRDAGSGREIVQQSIDAIHALCGEIESTAEVVRRLEEESSEIGGVLDVIRDIAEQTNLLALNAAIEAARAGEQGRGFAVVADEVRTLASRTQQSTQDIQEMIERLQQGTGKAARTMSASLEQVEETVARTGRTGESLETVTRAVDSISERNVQIATAAEEQRAMVEEINRNVEAIRKMAEQSARGAQETQSASGELRQRMAQLQASVARFRA